MSLRGWITAKRGRFPALECDTLEVGGTSVDSASLALTGLTATATELNKNAGVTAGVALASKTAVLGSSKQLSGINRPILTKSADYPIVAADANSIIIVTGVDKVLTLPATIAGFEITVVLAPAALSAGTGLTISPNAVDQIVGNGFTVADDKDAILAGAGDRAGDSITLVGDGTNGWYITAVTGTWTREA